MNRARTSQPNRNPHQTPHQKKTTMSSKTQHQQPSIPSDPPPSYEASTRPTYTPTPTTISPRSSTSSTSSQAPLHRAQEQQYRPSHPMTPTKQQTSWPGFDPSQRAALEHAPGCCGSTRGGCCFSDLGGGCFSDSGGCCFSSTGGCCFSSEGGCCFSSEGGCCFARRGGCGVCG